ncbi:MAG: hypothetical protein O3B80_04690, partial [Proteobacteria bacterium]|nr:hypothetical protein [Pseudomonadota bacterium]
WPKYNPSGDNSRISLHNNAYQYGSQFYFNFSGMSKRNIIATDGLNGQYMLIDLDNSKIVVTNSAARGWDVKTLALNVIKKGKLPK